MEAVSTQELGRRISQARERASLTQDQLADQLSVDRTALSKIERGTRRISALELLDLSRALGISMDSLFRDPIPAIVSHRSSHGLSTADSAIDKILDSIASGVEFVDSETGFLPEPPEAFHSPSCPEEAEAMAAKARALLGESTSEPLTGLGEALDRIGLLIFSKDIGADSADAGLIMLRKGAVGFVNSSAKPGRRRLAAAHEFGHFLLADDYVIDHKIAGVDETRLEGLIDRFARALLLPPKIETLWRSLRSEKGDRSAAVIMASMYRVDMSTLAHRLRDLELISFPEMNDIREYRTTQADIVEFGLLNTEEFGDTTLPRSYQMAILDMYRKELLTDRRALDLLRGTFAPDDLPTRSQHAKEEIWGYL